jgi:hypothetical protein
MAGRGPGASSSARCERPPTAAGSAPRGRWRCYSLWPAQCDLRRLASNGSCSGTAERAIPGAGGRRVSRDEEVSPERTDSGVARPRRRMRPMPASQKAHPGLLRRRVTLVHGRPPRRARLVRLGRVRIGLRTRDGTGGKGHRRVGGRNGYLLRPHARLPRCSAPERRPGGAVRPCGSPTHPRLHSGRERRNIRHPPGLLASGAGDAVPHSTPIGSRRTLLALGGLPPIAHPSPGVVVRHAWKDSGRDRTPAPRYAAATTAVGPAIRLGGLGAIRRSRMTDTTRSFASMACWRVSKSETDTPWLASRSSRKA